MHKLSDHLKEGQEVKVKALEVDRQGRDHLSIKETGLHRTAKLRFGYSSLRCLLY